MSALFQFQGGPRAFGKWFRTQVQTQPLPWTWTTGDANLLQTWGQTEDWTGALRPGHPTDLDRSAAALGMLLAVAHQHCFRESGDKAVWLRLQAVMGLPPQDLGGSTRDIAQALGLPWDATGTEGLIHVLPFLRLAGCPNQALVPLGRLLRLKGSVAALPQRFQALCVARWPLERDQQALVHWLTGPGGPHPDCLQEVDADLLRRDAAARPPTRLSPMLVRCQNSAQGLIFALSWRDPAKTSPILQVWPEALAQAPQVPLGTRIDPDQAFQVSGKGWVTTWTPPESPSAWRRSALQSPAWEPCSWPEAEQALLPRGWSLDGEAVDGWKLVHLAEAVTFFDPDQRPWPLPRAAARVAFSSPFSLLQQPGLPVLQADDLPRGLRGLEARSAEGGSSLGPSLWRDQNHERLPWGHLVLSWESLAGQRLSRRVFVIPSLELEVLQAGDQDLPRVLLRGHACLPGHQESVWYRLIPERHAGSWQAQVTLQPPAGPPCTLVISGETQAWGGRLAAGDGSLVAFQQSPWAVAPNFLRQAARAGYHMRVQLPEGRRGGLHLEGGGPLLPHVQLGGQNHLQPMELALVLEPLMEALPDTARPVRVNAVWETEPGTPPGQANLFRLFASPAPVSLRLVEGRIQITDTKAHSLDPSQWVLQAGSMVHATGGLRQWPLAELPLERLSDHTVRTPWPEFLKGPGAPWFLQLRPVPGGPPVMPLSIHADSQGQRIPMVAEAFALALQAKGIGDVPAPAQGLDQRDSLLGFLYRLAERHDLAAKFLSPAEQDHWLQFLSDDYLFSQPWTLGLALRRPAEALIRLSAACPDDAAFGAALSRVGQGTFLPWLLSRRDLEALDGELDGRLNRAVEARLGTLAALLAPGELSRNPTLRHVFARRVCEEGLPLLAPPIYQGQLLALLDLSPKALQEIRTWADFEGLFLGHQTEGVLKEALRELMDGPNPPPLLPKGPGNGQDWPGLAHPEHALHGLSRLGAWGRAYRAWWQGGQGPLLGLKPWPEAMPTLFRHHAILMTLFTLHPF